MLRYLFVVLWLSLVGAGVGLTFVSGAIAQENPRKQYTEGRAALDALIRNRNLGEAMRLFAPGVVISESEAEALDAEFAARYPENFTNHGIVRSELLKNGFRHEMVAYWNETDYFYVYLLIHSTTKGARLLSLSYDSDFEALYMNF